MVREASAALPSSTAPSHGGRPGDLDVQEERSARQQVMVEASKGFLVLLPRAAQSEDPAGDDCAVAPGRFQLVQGLYEQRRRQDVAPGFLAAGGDHVTRDVAAIDVESRAQPGQQQPARAAPGIQCRLSSLDEMSEVRDFRPIEIERCPPFE